MNYLGCPPGRALGAEQVAGPLTAERQWSLAGRGLCRRRGQEAEESAWKVREVLCGNRGPRGGNHPLQGWRGGGAAVAELSAP